MKFDVRDLVENEDQVLTYNYFIRYFNQIAFSDHPNDRFAMADVVRGMMLAAARCAHFSATTHGIRGWNEEMQKNFVGAFDEALEIIAKDEELSQHELH